jgi:hypothetical protein
MSYRVAAGCSVPKSWDRTPNISGMLATPEGARGRAAHAGLQPERERLREIDGPAGVVANLRIPADRLTAVQESASR